MNEALLEQIDFARTMLAGFKERILAETALQDGLVRSLVLAYQTIPSGLIPVTTNCEELLDAVIGGFEETGLAHREAITRLLFGASTIGWRHFPRMLQFLGVERHNRHFTRFTQEFRLAHYSTDVVRSKLAVDSFRLAEDNVIVVELASPTRRILNRLAARVTGKFIPKKLCRRVVTTIKIFGTRVFCGPFSPSHVTATTDEQQ